jgi:hypothetical protein
MTSEFILTASQDPGGSMMPWLLSLLLLFLHLPSVVIRAVQWESAQYLVNLIVLRKDVLVS